MESVLLLYLSDPPFIDVETSFKYEFPYQLVGEHIHREPGHDVIVGGEEIGGFILIDRCLELVEPRVFVQVGLIEIQAHHLAQQITVKAESIDELVDLAVLLLIRVRRDVVAECPAFLNSHIAALHVMQKQFGEPLFLLA